MKRLFDTLLRQSDGRPDDGRHNASLRAVFQPIAASAGLAVLGYEGLIRGPAGSSLESPAALFAWARANGRQRELETACLRTVLAGFTRLALPGKLFVNVSAAMLLGLDGPDHERPAADAPNSQLARLLRGLGADPARVVIEITEEQAVADYPRLLEVARGLAALGYALAIDDLGAGYASLRLWLELRPSFVKLDNAFVRGSDADPFKRCFLGAMQHLARCADACLIAEGVESAAELALLQKLGVAYVQGYHLARPSALPPRRLDPSQFHADPAAVTTDQLLQLGP